MSNEIKEKFKHLVYSLEPEALYCDGEISPAQGRAKERKLRKEWTDLERQVGRAVTEDEVWGWLIPR